MYAIIQTLVMLYFISALSKLVEPGITLTRHEVIRRYRQMAGCKKGLLQLLYMTQFTMMGKNEKGELFIV